MKEVFKYTHDLKVLNFCLGLNKYRIDACQEALDEHAHYLREKNEQRLMHTGLNASVSDKSAGIDRFEAEVQSDIRELADDLTKLKVSSIFEFFSL